MDGWQTNEQRGERRSWINVWTCERARGGTGNLQKLNSYFKEQLWPAVDSARN